MVMEDLRLLFFLFHLAPAVCEVHTHIDPVSDRYIIEGSDLAIGSCALDCDTAMWEVKFGKSPEGVRIGVKRYNKKKSPDFSLALGDGEEEKDSSETTSWYLKNAELKEGDVIGVYWDQTDLPMLSFSLNGKSPRPRSTAFAPPKTSTPQ
jgi:hypothetical protein